MNQPTQTTARRFSSAFARAAAAAVAAATLLAPALPARAGMLTAFAAPPQTNAFAPTGNIFAGTNGANTSLSVAGLFGANNTETGLIGPGFNSSVTVGVGVLNNLTLAINTNNNGQMVVSGSGVANGLSSFSATRSFSNITLDDNTAYTFTLSRLTASTASVLASTNVLISLGNTTVANTATGTGLLNTVNLVNLFNGGTDASFTFTTGNVDNTAALNVNISGGLGLSALGNTFTFTAASLDVAAVPEPSVWSIIGVGLLGCVGLNAVRRRARLA